MAADERLIVEVEAITKGFQKVKRDIDLLTKGTVDVGKKITFDPKVVRNITRGTEQIKTNMEALKNPIKSTADSLKKWQGVLLQTGLSMLFFGMAVQRVGTTIIKSAIQSFNKITEGTDAASGALAVLQVHFELLKFIVGAALVTLLEGYLPTLINIILAVSDWVEQNSELTAEIILWTTAIGTALLVIGILSTFLNGMLGLFSAMGIGVTAFALGLAKLAGIAILINVGMKIFGRDFVPGTEDILLDAFKAAFGGFLVAGPAGAAFALVIALVLDVGAAILGITNAQASALILERITLAIANGWERATFEVLALGRALASLKPGGETPREALRAIREEREALEKVQKRKVLDFDINFLETRNANLDFSGVTVGDIKLKSALGGVAGFQPGTAETTVQTQAAAKAQEEQGLQTKKSAAETAKATKTIDALNMSVKEWAKVNTETLAPVKEVVTAFDVTKETAVLMGQEFVALQKKLADTPDLLRGVGDAIDQLMLRGLQTVNSQLRAFGIDTNAAGVPDFRASLGGAILSQTFGNTLAGLGQATPGALSRADVSVGARATSAAFTRPVRPTYNINPTFVSGGASPGDDSGRFA